MKTYTNLKCPDCDNGVIVMSANKSALETVIEVKACNICKAWYGIKGCQNLKLIAP